MKILHGIHSLNPAHGGTTFGLRGMVQELLAQGHQTEILVLDAPDSPWLSDWPCPVHALGTGLGNYGFNPSFARFALNQMPRFDHAVIHGLWQFHGCSLRSACLRSSVPYSLFPHGMLDAWFAKAYPLKHLQKRLYWRLIEHRVFRDASRVFFTTEGELDSGRTTFSPFSVKPAFAPFGISPPPSEISEYQSAFATRNPDLTGRKTLLFLGRLHPKKGCDLMIQGAAHWLQTLPPSDRQKWHLRFVGPCEDQSYFNQLKAMAQSLGLFTQDLISFHDAVSGDQKWQELAAADALVLPSHQENFGVVIAEAFACGTPALISDKVNGWRAMESMNAALVAPDSVAGVEQLLNQWANLSPENRALMSFAARNYYDTNMSAAVSVSRFLAGAQSS